MKRFVFSKLTLAAAMLITLSDMPKPIAAAEMVTIRGTVRQNDGKAIPAGKIEICLDDTANQAGMPHCADKTQISSNGKARHIDFSIPAPKSALKSPTFRILARLKRTDGWLIAGGRAKPNGRLEADISLSKVMY